MLFSNCCSLEILKLACPKLTSLFLQVYLLSVTVKIIYFFGCLNNAWIAPLCAFFWLCFHLIPVSANVLLLGLFQSCNVDEEAVETAIAQCSILETLDVRFCPKVSLPFITYFFFSH